jgi:hypothetical protein
MSFANSIAKGFHSTQELLLDLHDPKGVYFHRALNACLAALVAAIVLSLFPAIAQSLIVIAALCFVMTTNTTDRPGRPTTLLGSLFVVLLSTSLLILTHTQPILQALVLIGLGFLVHYLPQFGAAFSGGLFVWILCLLASAGNPGIAKLPETLLNIILAWVIVYLCYFWILPYRPYPVFLSLLRRTRIRLGKRLQDAIAYFNTELEGQDAADLMRNDNLDQRIVSLMTAQDWLIQRLDHRKQLSEKTIAHYRQILEIHEELFAAILVLEQSLLILKSTTSVPVQLQVVFFSKG